MIALSHGTLAQLPPNVTGPAYDRAACRVGIVHFGVGGFHRAHQAAYVDRMLAAGHTDWAICGVGMLPADTRIRDVLADQNGLYTLVTRAPDSTANARVIGSIIDYRFAPDDPNSVIDVLSSAATKIVSLTITEGGYDPASPVFDLLTQALARRRAAGIAPFTVMSCDNIQGNGAVARAALTTCARRRNHELGDWIDTDVAFPNTMVDRITPATTPEVIDSVRSIFGIDDGWPVQSESFAQWVIEDDFPAGRPPLEDFGITVVEDVAPYEMMKLRLLNASHQVMSYLGILAGYTYVHEVLDDPDLAQFVASYMRTEAAPTLPKFDNVDIDGYIDELIHRFGSDTISDTLARQIVDASVRIPTFLLPVVSDRLATGASITHAALTIAAWCRLYEVGEAELVDPRWGSLRGFAHSDRDGSFTENPDVFGNLAGDMRFRVAYQEAKQMLLDLGPRAAARMVTAGEARVR